MTMSLSLPFNNDNALTKIAIWTAANPVITRIALVALPAALAVAMAAFGHYSLFNLPPTGGGAGCGGAC
jgi:hypothetical protein